MGDDDEEVFEEEKEEEVVAGLEGAVEDGGDLGIGGTVEAWGEIWEARLGGIVVVVVVVVCVCGLEA